MRLQEYIKLISVIIFVLIFIGIAMTQVQDERVEEKCIGYGFDGGYVDNHFRLKETSVCLSSIEIPLREIEESWEKAVE